MNPDTITVAIPTRPCPCCGQSMPTDRYECEPCTRQLLDEEARWEAGRDD